MLIRTGDTVEVIAGNDRGQKSRVIKVDRATGKAVVEGVNRVKKHIRRSQKYPQGGVLSKEMPVQLSNVKYVCPSCGSAARLGARFLDDGSKERFCKKCNASAGQIAPAKKAHATCSNRQSAKARQDNEGRQEVTQRRVVANNIRVMAKKKEKSEEKAGSPPPTPRLQTVYEEQIVPQLKEKLGATTGSRCRGSRRSSSAWASAAAITDKKHMEEATAALAEITGQKPVRCKSQEEHRRFPAA